jgi:prolycopene isomerase
MEKSDYEYIVIGAGIGGLLISNMLAIKNKKVLLLEKNPFAGGYYAQFCNGKYEMDYAVSYFLDFNQKGLLADFFKELKIDNKVDFIKLPIADRYIFPDFEYELKSDYLMLKSDLCSLFPDEKEGIEKFFHLMKKIYTSFSSIGRMDPIIIKYLYVDYFSFLNDITKDERLKAILAARAFGADVSMITMLSYLGKLIFGGLYQERNHQSIPKLLSESFLLNNGTIIYNEVVEKLIIEKNKVKGVLSNNKFYEADQIISACDMTKIFCNKFEPDISNEIKDNVSKRKKSLSSITLFVVLKKLSSKIIENPVGRIYIFNEYDIQKIYKQKEDGLLNIKNGLKINIQHVLDKDFKDKKNYLVRIEIDTNINSILDNKNLNKIENEIKDFVFSKLEFNQDDILESKILFPKNFEDITFASEGAGSGWAPDTSYTDFTKYEKVLADNFHQTGCWDKFGSGIFPIYLSAKRIVKEIT